MNLKYARKPTQLMLLASLGLGLIFSSVSAIATNDWVNYRSADRTSYAPSRPHAPQSPYGDSNYKGYADPYGTPLAPQHYPIRPPVQHYPAHPSRPYPNQYPHHGYPHQYPQYPQQNSISIIYQQSFPQQSQYHSEQRGFVYGDANSRIESSSYMLISDWRRYNLPDPALGMHWIYQNGRYLQVPNDR